MNLMSRYFGTLRKRHATSKKPHKNNPLDSGASKIKKGTFQKVSRRIFMRHHISVPLSHLSHLLSERIKLPLKGVWRSTLRSCNLW